MDSQRRLIVTFGIWLATLVLCGLYAFDVLDGSIQSGPPLSHLESPVSNVAPPGPDTVDVTGSDKEKTSSPIKDDRSAHGANNSAEQRSSSDGYILVSVVLALISVGITVLAFFAHFISNDFVAEQRDPIKRSEQGTLRRLFDSQGSIVVFFFGVPALAFFLTQVQHHHEDLAVFVMAIAAIYVAGEHFASLEKQSESFEVQVRTLRDVKDELDIQVDNIKIAVGSVEMVVGSIEKAVCSIEKAVGSINKTVASIENALGTADGQKQIYEAIAKVDRSVSDRGIYAFYYHFEIDKAWWATGRWDSVTDNKEPGLYSSLKIGAREDVLIVSPIPFPQAADVLDKEIDRAKKFHDFIGLVWYWMVLRKFQQRTKKPAEFKYRIVIAYTSLWVHVIDNEVFQVFGDFPNQLKVRRLTFDMRDKGASVVEWGRREVSETASRGQPAEEYICALIAKAAMEITGGIKFLSLNAIVSQLGGDDWCKDKARFNVDLDESTAKARCAKLLEDFIGAVGESKVQTGVSEGFSFEPGVLLAKILQ